ncbi:MAG: type VI secretion system membrane subunit TssM [Pseudomonadota bacterium]
MLRFWHFISSGRVLGMTGLALLAAFLVVDPARLKTIALWLGLGLLALAAGWGSFLLLRYLLRLRKARRDANSETSALRNTMLDAITTIRTSKLGLLRGKDALYELPWYMLIGSEESGKSSAITHSGLHFPISGSKAGDGCDWHFTPEGILLDTAGRFASGRADWLSLLSLLRTFRTRAPINGIVLAISIADLLAGEQQAAVELGKQLRTRVQELTERLGVYAPVYIVFTKLDLVAGFCDFFHDAGKAERERAWGATIRYNRRRTHHDVMAFFDQHFDELHAGLKEMSLASLAASRKQTLRPGVITFPLEFAALRAPLRTFLATLFEENTYQFRPVFRGFYFTSALQQGAPQDLCSARVARRFDLQLQARNAAQEAPQGSYFLHDLFRKVIFADKNLVARYMSPGARRLQYGAFCAATLLLGCALGGWSWSYIANRQLIAHVQADLDKVVRMQERRVDLQSRLDALEILQDRIVQLEKYRSDAPLMLTFGLYQGDVLERKLRDEYFAGVRDVMVMPVTANIEALLAAIHVPAGGAGAMPGSPYQDASPASVTDGYNALKTYLMLGDKSRAEAGHLNDQMTRFWRGWLESQRGAMPREQMIRSAERLMRFHVSQVADPAWPQPALKLALLDSAREHLRRVARGTPARERAYADIKARAATRFPAMTVAAIVGEQDQKWLVGSHAVPGAYTRAAWEKFVSGAIREAANKELQTRDWVLNTVSRDDLTLEGSPEQIQKALTAMYKADYAREWLKFVQGVSISELAGFDASVQAMNRLGDPHSSPIATLLKAVHEETAWDSPAARAPGGAAEQGAMAWFREKVLRNKAIDAPAAPALAMGPIGREFAGVARLVGLHDKDASLMGGYLDSLSRLRTRLNLLKNQGDPGPGAKLLMQQTLDGNGSELADALKFVDEQMLTGMSDSQKQALRPLLVRPLTQTFAMIVPPSESELNKTWQAQVIEPFRQNLAGKYPFAPGSRVEASQSEIAQLFGPEGMVAKFVTTAMGPLVLRRGDALAARTWANQGISLAPQAVAAFPGWIAPLGSHGGHTLFQLQPLPAPGTSELVIEIDGQVLRYKNTAPAWTSMVHPANQGIPGARITATTLDGRTVEVFNQAGQFGLKKMIDAASRKRKGDVFELQWSAGAVNVALDLKIVSSPGPVSGAFLGMRLPETIVGRTATSLAAIGELP